MKKLFIIRHAKSSWAISGQPDFLRTLNQRGMQDAPEMAKRLISRQPHIDLFLSSPATRAKQTCEFFCTEYAKDHSLIHFDERLYHAPEQMFYKVLEEIKEEINSVALFSHNPGITDFANSLDTGIRIDDMPTCAIYAIEADIALWQDFKTAAKRFLFFDFPKNRKA